MKIDIKRNIEKMKTKTEIMRKSVRKKMNRKIKMKDEKKGT